MARCKCKYYLRDNTGQLVCSVCGKPAPKKPVIEDKQLDQHETKEAPLYISKSDGAKIAALAAVEAAKLDREVMHASNESAEH